MYLPSKKEFIKKTNKANLIPVHKEIFADFITPLLAYKRIRSKNSFLFESVEGEERIARYSFLGSDPSVVIFIKKNKVTIRGKSRNETLYCDDPFDYIKKFMSNFKTTKVKGLPRFYGGLVGYIGYDCIRYFEDIPDTCCDDLKLYDSILMLTDTILIFDHITHKIKVVSNAHIQSKLKNDLIKQYNKAVKRIDSIIDKLNKSTNESIPEIKYEQKPSGVKSNFKKGDFKKILSKAKDYIKKGDIIQVVISQRFKARFNKDPLNAYMALRSINPSPYMFYLSFGSLKLIGSSPEIMVRSEQGIVRIRPIAGTRKRGKDEQEDNLLIIDLLSDSKERAEHLMLVDLARNDLGRACKTGTIKIGEFMVIEKYSHVMHIVSDCAGTLEKGKDSFDVLRASFPAGTVTGAPKIRAMEIIDELENIRRGPYAGCVGYFSFSGNMDTCITIRTIIIKNNTAYVQAGAGIVADSVPENEYKETQNKAAAMLKAIASARSVQ
ncbi:MAG: anthranilate synthase component I [Candidatus Omnitrophota bacterium]|nr:MAG: anthranilate synthase component I [Candidatus Omnitrophota bacterium]